MNRKKTGTKKKRIRARALDPYKRVNVCLGLDAYLWYKSEAKRGGFLPGTLIRQTLEGIWSRMNTVEIATQDVDALPLQGRKQGKKASKTAKMPNLVKQG